jgi:phospholipase/carboxylesterase
MNAVSGPLSPLHADPASELSFRLLQPAPPRPRACLVLLHGVGGDETNLAALPRDLPADTLVVLVRGPLALGADQFAWFRVAFTGNGPRIVPSEAEHSRKALVALLGQLQTAYGIAPQRTIVAGFSQGGIMSASVALSAPQRVAGFAILSGRILPELEPQLAPREQLAGLQAFVGHGEFDSKLPVSWAQRAERQLTDLGVAHQLALYPIDHAISPAMQADFIEWTTALLARPLAP